MTSANYHVISDRQATPKDTMFDLPQQADLESPTILSCRITVNDPDDLNWNIQINGKNVFRSTIDNGVPLYASIQEVIWPDDNVLHRTKNHFTIEVPSGEGTLKVSDVILWYRVKP
jgi:hypothetical protein